MFAGLAIGAHARLRRRRVGAGRRGARPADRAPLARLHVRPRPARLIGRDDAAAAGARRATRRCAPACPPTRRPPAGEAAAAAPAPARVARPAPQQRSCAWRASCCAAGTARPPRSGRWVEADHRLPDRRALRARSRSPPRCSSPRVTFIALLAWGGFAAVYSSPAVTASARADAPARMTAHRSAYRDDGAARAARSAARSARASALPARRRSRWSAALALAVAAALAIDGAAARRARGGRGDRRADRAARLAAAARRAARLGRAAAAARRSSTALLIWIAAHRRPRRDAGRVRAARRARLPPLRPRLPAAPPRVPPPAWLSAARGGWDGRVLARLRAALAGALARGLLVAARAARRAVRRRRPS